MTACGSRCDTKSGKKKLQIDESKAGARRVAFRTVRSNLLLSRPPRTLLLINEQFTIYESGTL